MAVEIRGTYAGNLNVDLVHEPSGATLRTAAPVDNQGDGSSFSPTDLVAAALGSCMLTLMGITAEREGIDLTGLSFRLEKHMRSDPRRIDRIPVEIVLPPGLDGSQRQALEDAARGCPVCHSLLEAIDRPLRFVSEEVAVG